MGERGAILDQEGNNNHHHPQVEALKDAKELKEYAYSLHNMIHAGMLKSFLPEEDKEVLDEMIQDTIYE